MHTAISCASCNRPLRIPSELVGQTVRCPFCTDAFTAVADPSIQLEEAVLNKAAVHVEETAQQERAVTLLEAEPPLVEESLTLDLEGPVKVEPPKPWATWVFVRSDSDRRLWGEMQAEISAEGLRLYRGRKEFIVPIGCEATWISGGRVRVVVGSRTVEFQIKKKHVYKARIAADVAGFLNGERPMPANKGYRWPWYQWLLLLAPLALIGVLIAGELPETPMKPLKGFGIFMFAFLAPVLAYAVWHLERLPVAARWTAASLVVGGVFLFSGLMYYFGPNLPPAAAYANWSKFAPPNGAYSVSMPAPPLTETEFVSGMSVVKSSARVKPNQMFIVAYADLPGTFDNQWQRDSAFQRGQQYIRTLYPNASFWSGFDRPMNLDDNPGKEWTFDQGSGRNRATVVVREYLVGSRLYMLITSDSIGSNGTKFLESFLVQGAARSELPAPVDWPNLTAYWSFDRGQGFDPVKGDSLLEDTGNIGAQPLRGCQLTNGRRGKGLEMKGQPNDYFDYGTSPRLNFNDTDQFTIAGWFKTTAAFRECSFPSRNRNDPMAILNVAVENGLAKCRDS